MINPKRFRKPVKIQARKKFSKEEYGEDWASLSFKCRQRDGWRCKKCGRKPESRRDIHADHIIPITKGGRNKLSNLQSLCVDCHKKKHPHMQVNKSINKNWSTKRKYKPSSLRS